MSKLLINGHFLHQRVTGVQRYAREIMNGFDELGYDYDVAEPSSWASLNKLSMQLWEQGVLSMQTTDETALWSPTNTGPIYARNHIVSLHDVGVFPHPEWFDTTYVRWKRMLIPRLAQHCRGILTVSEFSKTIICKYLSVQPEKVKVVYNGVDTDRFKPATERDINRVQEKYDLSATYLLSLGSMDPRKNLPALLEAWDVYTTEAGAGDTELVIAGGSSETLGAVTQQHHNERVQFLGYVDEDDLAPLYSGAHGFLFPSLFEGFGLPVVEAMACGTPVLTSNTGALDEITGEAALKVDPTKVNAIKEGIEALLASSNRRVTLVGKGFEQVQQFSWNKAAQEIYRYMVL